MAPEYLAPGVFIEEFEIGPKPIEGVATGTASFLGETERGPTEPTLVTSWSAFYRVLGGVRRENGGMVNGFLPHAVRGFFDNGGRRCYVCRIVRRGDDPATAATLAAGPYTFRATGEGAWGRNVRVVVTNYETDDNDTSERPGQRVTVEYWRTPPESFPERPSPTDPRPDHQEVFDEITLDSSSPDFIEKRLRRGNSALVTVVPSGADGNALEAVSSFMTSEGGEDGVGLEVGDFIGSSTDLDDRRGLSALVDPRFDEVALLYAPDASSTEGLAEQVILHCENHQYRFAVLDAPGSIRSIGTLRPRSNSPEQSGRETQYASFYYPWIHIMEPETSRPVLVPPGGHVLGIYSRSDNRVGVWKAPANEVVRGALELEFQITTGEQEVLNPRGVNVIRAFEGRGIRVWGARTLSSDPLWRYNSVRRLFIFLEASIFRSTQWVVFEPNGPRLWARVAQTVRQFLRGLYRSGALLGRTEEEAFFVRCDRSVMTADDIDNGRLVCEIGVSPVRPAEFVIFRIAQLTAGAAEE